MGYQVIVDTDSLIEISNSINNTTNEISNSIISLQKVCNDLGANIQDQNISNFQNNFGDYLSRLNNLTVFYKSISTTISNMSKEYDNVDNTDSAELKNLFDKKEIDG